MAEKSDKANLSILAIVAFVGAVSIFIILIHSGKMNLFSSDISGQAITVTQSKITSSPVILALSMSQDSDADGIVNGIETKIGTKYLTDDLSSEVELDLDIDKFYISGSTITDGIVSGSITGSITIARDTSYGMYLNIQDTARDDYIAFADLSTTPFSFILSARVKPVRSDTLGIKTIVTNPTSICGYPHFSLDAYQGEYRIAVNLDDLMISAIGGTVNTGQWQEVVGIYSDNKEMLYLFVDGILVAEEIASGAGRVSGSKPIYVGSGDPECNEGRDFEGALGFLKIYGYYIR